MRKSSASDGRSVAILCKKRVNISLSANVVIKYIVNYVADIAEYLPVFEKSLIVLRVACDVEIIPLTSVPFRIYSVQRECNDSVDICSESRLGPSGIEFA